MLEYVAIVFQYIEVSSAFPKVGGCTQKGHLVKSIMYTRKYLEIYMTVVAPISVF